MPPAVNRIVLDASAMLAILNGEPGAENLTEEMIAGSIASTVNIAEVLTKLIREGGEPSAAWRHVCALFPSAEPFTAEQARIAAGLTRQTRALGLSLGDRACLALAIAKDATAWTTDKSWKKLTLSVSVNLMR
jgi:PIN domain nuclease of toxin-antitoxin system